MKKVVLATALALASLVNAHPSISFAAITTPPSGSAAVKSTPVIPGVVYVKFRSGSKAFGQAQKGSTIQSVGASKYDRLIKKLQVQSVVAFDPLAPKDAITHDLGIDRMYVIYYSNLAIDPHEAVREFMASGEVENGSARYAFPISRTPNDPRVTEQYALTNIHVANAWDQTTGDTSVIIADVDCAINIDHEDLQNALKINWGETGLDKNGKDKRTNGIDDDGDGVIDDWGGVDVVGQATRVGTAFQPDGDPRPDNASMSHGTETAGCIAATGNNGIGIAGVAYSAKLLPIKASDDGSNITGGYEGIHWAVAHGARIVNCSWGGPITQQAEVDYANTYLQEAIARNVLIVAAAGNASLNNDQISNYPSNGPAVLSVGSTNESDKASSFSDFGHTVCVWAPGEAILTTGYPGNSTYSAVDGTSFASPITAGVAGLVMSLHPDWPVRFVSRQLVQTCDNVVNTNDRNEYWGRVNAETAVASPVGPGLLVTGYSLNGVANDSLGLPGTSQTLRVIFKNVVANDASNLSAQLISEPGYTTVGLPSSLGSLSVNSTGEGVFQISRTNTYSKGYVTVLFRLTDAVGSYTDTVTIQIPLKQIAGFESDDVTLNGTGVKRTSNTSGWASYGFEQTNAQTVSMFNTESDNSWSGAVSLQSANPAYCVEAIDSMTAWFGTGPTSLLATVIRTDDGGSSFNEVDVSSITPFVNSVHFFDANNGVFLGDPKTANRWGIGYTEDGGLSWKAIPKAITFAGGAKEAGWNNSAAWVGNNGWFGTNHFHIWRSTDRGQSWKLATTSLENSFAIAFDSDAMHGLAAFRPVANAIDTASANNASGLMSSTDGGATWNLVTLPVKYALLGGIQFLPHTHRAILSTNVGVYTTNDYGVTWGQIPVPTGFNGDGSDLSLYRGNGRYSISVNTATNGLLTYSEPMDDPIQPVGGVAETSSSAEGSSLEQNSPNPVSGLSTINFTLSGRGTVHLSLFDAIGREVAVLANGIMGPGSSSIAVNTANLTPGVYYYVLDTESGEHITRSMTVLR